MRSLVLMLLLISFSFSEKRKNPFYRFSEINWSLVIAGTVAFAEGINIDNHQVQYIGLSFIATGFCYGFTFNKNSIAYIRRF